MELDSAMPEETDCPEQKRLVEKVRYHLRRIAELSYSTADAVARDDHKVAELDRQAEIELGEKERTLGALRQHKRDHGC